MSMLTIITPIVTPRVLDQPVIKTIFITISNGQHSMIDVFWITTRVTVYPWNHFKLVLIVSQWNHDVVQITMRIELEWFLRGINANRDWSNWTNSLKKATLIILRDLNVCWEGSPYVVRAEPECQKNSSPGIRTWRTKSKYLHDCWTPSYG